ncbi:PHP domain-containing protein [Radiobacillus kanasensis]|uniref:PHP domain-containing protein n=1 Tax=Radiobacillus kanasensis TaxID=2844358 RepID=UPI001E51CA8A|nr:PHP-associated domain-containing protein [Radiobacillus kanasensis]UFT99624.1 PHP domain-containing protein [Radiobacillus kanasensis]
MNIDFHSHVKISKKSTFMPDYFKEMMKEAKDNGLTALAMTEHFNTSRFTDIYDYLEETYTYEHGYYDINGLKLFPGMEVDIKETGHILLIGDRLDILQVREALDAHTEKESFVPFDELMKMTAPYNLLKIGAHPFRESTPLYHLKDEQLNQLDAFDLNGKDLYAQGVQHYQSKMREFSERLSRPVVGGSDTHQFFQYGCVYNEFEEDCQNVDDLKRCIHNRTYNVTVSQDLSLKVRAAIVVKELLKKQLEAKQPLSMR